jgi:hypothetical protein
MNVVSGTTLSLAPGIYSVQADPNPSYKFTGWSATSGVYVFEPSTNYTWINVTTSGGTLHANYRSTTLGASVWLDSYPSQGGTFVFANTTYSSGAVFGASIGTFPVRAVAAPGYRFVTWSPGFMSTMTNWSATSDVLLQHGNDYVTAVFSSVPVLTVPHALAGGGFAIDGTHVVGNVSLPQVGNLTYQLEAVTNPGFTFSHWTVSNPSHAWVASSTAAITSLQVNGSATVTPHFVGHPANASVGFTAHGGSILFNSISTVTGTGSVSVSPGTFVIAATAAAGKTFEGWNTTGSVHVGTAYVLTQRTSADVENSAGTWVAWYNVTISGSGTVTARFSDTTHPVTFIDFPFTATLSANITANGTSHIVAAGATVELPSGVYTLTLTGGTISGLRWFANSNLTFSPSAGSPTTLTVSGSGTIYAVG